MIGPLKLFGQDPAALREMARTWWARPLAGALMADRPQLQELVLAVKGIDEQRVMGRLFPRTRVGQMPPSWQARLAAASQQLFCAPVDAMDEDEGFARAFAPYCVEGAWAPVILFERKPLRNASPNRKGDRRFIVSTEWIGVAQCKDADSPPEKLRRKRLLATPLDPQVEALLDGIEALDQLDRLSAAMLSLLDKLRYSHSDRYLREAAGILQARLEELD
ncbi:MAG: hypothetical protein AAFV53_10915 [Myxococcota bacterium]